MRSFFARLHRRYGKKMRGTERQSLVQDKMRQEAHLPSARPQIERAAQRGKPQPRVAIIGAGFSGLMAGYALAGHCDVTIFEARKRIGGRVWSKPRPGGLIEAGAELIGYNHPLWLKLAKEFSLGLSVTTSDTNFDALDLDMPLYLDGTKISEKKQKKIYGEMADAFGRMTRLSRKIDAHRPWRSANAKKYDNMSMADWIDTLDCSALTRRALEEQFSNDAGQPASKQNYLANLAACAAARSRASPMRSFPKRKRYDARMAIMPSPVAWPTRFQRPVRPSICPRRSTPSIFATAESCWKREASAAQRPARQL